VPDAGAAIERGLSRPLRRMLESTRI